MRTTLSIDDDVLAMAQRLARVRGSSVGKVMSDLARQSLDESSGPRFRNGFELFPVSNPDAVITSEMVNALRDDDP